MSITGIASLAKSLTGEVVLPDDRRYAKLRRVSNHAVNKHPAVIVRCATRQDVQLAVDFSHSKGLLTAVRSGVTASRVMEYATTVSSSTCHL